METKELKKLFKKYKKIYFELANSRYIFVWGLNREGVPHDTVHYGRMGAPRPDYTFSPYDIEKLEYSKPGLFRPGVISVIGTGNNVLLHMDYKKKSNMKMCELFNECLALYKQYGLGK